MKNVILHVEDDFGHALLVKRAFDCASVQCEIKHVTDGQAAVHYLQQKGPFTNPLSSPRPSLVLLDLNLPKVKGMDVLKKIKGDKEFRSIPVVILTTSNSAEDIRNAYESHADNYLTKPGSYSEFVELLHKLAEEWFVKSEI